MKKPSSKNINVILALLAVLFISLGYLCSQKGGKEGLNKICPSWQEIDKDGNCTNIKK